MSFNPLALILTLVGAYMLIKLRAFFILHPIRTFLKLIKTVKGKNQIKALTLALAGTLGVGNVFGVCLGIIIGGKGSVFWLFVSCIFACVLKYSEVVISFDNLSFNRYGACGGMAHTLYVTFKRHGLGLAYIYAFFCMMMSLVMGSALQAGTVSETVTELFDIKPVIIGIIFATITLVSIFRGVKIIEKITLIAIPLTTIVYIIVTGSIILGGFSRIPELTQEIIRDAVKPQGCFGGALSFLFSRGMKEGFSRGILSNEAGSGTSSMAHSRSGILNPAGAGLMGIVEVVFDTGILCMLTAYSVLLTVPDTSVFKTGMSLILYSVEITLGRGFTIAIFVSVLIFAYSTVVCWYYYGESSFLFMFKGRGRLIFLFLFVLSVFLGTLTDMLLLVSLTDIFMLVLTVLTLSVIIKKSDRIKFLSEKGGLINSNSIKESGSSNIRRRVRKQFSQASRPRR